VPNFTPSVQRVAPAGRKTSKSAAELLKYRCLLHRRFALRAMLSVIITYCRSVPGETDVGRVPLIRMLGNTASHNDHQDSRQKRNETPKPLPGSNLLNSSHLRRRKV